MVASTKVYKQPTIFDEFQCYNIPNVNIPWYNLQPTFGVSQANHKQGDSKQVAKVQEEPKKKKIRASSAYAIFFSERQLDEKLANPNAPFGQISQNVAKQWEMLSYEEKLAYKLRCENKRKNSITNAVNEKARQLMKGWFQ